MIFCAENSRLYKKTDCPGRSSPQNAYDDYKILNTNITSGMVAIESIVDIATSLDTYAASQLYFSANIVAEDAAGVAAIMMITVLTAGWITSPQSSTSLMIATIAMGSAICLRARNILEENFSETFPPHFRSLEMTNTALSLQY